MTEFPAKEAIENWRSLADMIERHITYPYGPPVHAAGEVSREEAANACIALCAGDRDKARTLWKLIVADCGYMPHCVAQALIHASSTNLVPDIEPPSND